MLQVAKTDLFNVYLCLSEVPLCREGEWTVLHIARSLVGDGLPSWRYVLYIEKLCLHEDGINADHLSHFKDLDVGDEVTPLDV